jgi:isoleucyl-tRNA synthetase
MAQSRKTTLEQLPEDSTYIAHEDEYVKLWNKVESDVDIFNDQYLGKPVNLYRKMIEKNKDMPEVIFMDGPPFVSGLLHPGHVLVGTAKSVMFIYEIMSGRLCVVKLGYDCHGLPAVNKTAAENGLTTIESIKKVGLANFNKMCENMIFKYSKSWTPLIQRFGRHADFDNTYMTRDKNFMETCFWIFKQFWNKGLVYKGYKVMAYSYANQTSLSNFEAAMNYVEKETKSIYVGFELVKNTNEINETKTKDFFVAWTTTPWTLPANMALCVNKDITYVRISVDNDSNIYILGKNCVKNLFNKKSKIKILGEMKGSELVGMKYIPLYEFINETKQMYQIVSDNYVMEGDNGSAIVHLAPAFGEDDFRVCVANNIVNNINISDYCPLDESGKYTDIVSTYKGRLVFDCEDDIRAELKNRNVLFKTQLYKHNYPYCWRSDTPLIYRTVKSWYIKVVDLRDRMIELISTVNITPIEIRNRFRQWLSNTKDWAISRSTSYATPIPLWVNDEDESDVICVGSIDELAKLSGKNVEDINNLHPEFVNDIVIEMNGKKYHRIMDTFDCWYESGAVPMGQIHYPFAKESKVIEDREYLSDFICEGSDQTRGWFYTLLVISTAIFNKAPYRNVICTGMILDEDGRKFSKKLGNYVDPMDAINTFGADILRIYLINSPAMNADCLKYSDKAIKQLKIRFTPYINGVKFWIEHAMNYLNKRGIDHFNIPDIKYDSLTNLMDKWIILRTDKLINNVNNSMSKFKLGDAINYLIEFIDELTNWYIKFNRNRIKGLNSINNNDGNGNDNDNNNDKETKIISTKNETKIISTKNEEKNHDDWFVSLSVLYNVLMKYCRLWAPFMPFLSEHIYQYLRHCSNRFTNVDSVMLTNYPTVNDNSDQSKITCEGNNDTLQMFQDLQRVCSMVRSMRDTSPMHNKLIVPIKTCTIYHNDNKYLEILKNNISLVQTELNCQQFNFEKLNENTSIRVDPDRKVIGQMFKKDSANVIKLLTSQTEEFMMKVYNKTEMLKYCENGFDVILDEKYYNIIKKPKEKIQGNTIMSLIDNDLMVSIDYTYDEVIHNIYQNKRMFIAIQNIRKNMGIRPWNKVKIILDTKLMEVLNKWSGENYLIESLDKSLSNAEIMIADFSDDEFYSSLNGLRETEIHKIYGENFEWELFNTKINYNNSNIKTKTKNEPDLNTLTNSECVLIVGKVMVYYKK